MSLNIEEQKEIIGRLNIIINQDEYIENSEITYFQKEDKFVYKTWDLLLQLLSSYSLSKEKEQFLIEKIFSSGFSSHRLFFYISCYYWLLEKFVEYYWYYWHINRSYDEASKFLVFLNGNSNYFLKYFNQEQLNNLLNIFQSQNQYCAVNNYNSLLVISSQLIKEIVNYQFNELSKNLVWINIEINKDKEELKQIINYFWFDTKYNEFLTNLDKHFYSEIKDSIEIAWMIWTFRQFNNDIIIDIALEVAKIEWLNEIPKVEWSKSTKQIGLAWDYLKEKFWLSNNEEKFLEYFTKILHEEWWHAFLSSIEYFRLTKNITIEIILMLLYKLREFKENNQK